MHAVRQEFNNYSTPACVHPSTATWTHARIRHVAAPSTQRNAKHNSGAAAPPWIHQITAPVPPHAHTHGRGEKFTVGNKRRHRDAINTTPATSAERIANHCVDVATTRAR